MDLHQFYKDHYFHEANRRHQLTSALALPTGVLTFLIGAIAVMISGLTVPFNLLETIQLILAVMAGVSIVITVYFLFRSYFNYTYGYIATPKELLEYLELLISHNKHHGKTKSDAETSLMEYIDTEYASKTHINIYANDLKSYNLHKANGFLIVSVVFVFFAGLTYTWSSINSAPQAQKIEIVNFSDIQKEIRQMAEEPKPEPQPEPTPPPADPPSPPPGRLIKEGEVPVKRED